MRTQRFSGLQSTAGCQAPQSKDYAGPRALHSVSKTFRVIYARMLDLERNSPDALKLQSAPFVFQPCRCCRILLSGRGHQNGLRNGNFHNLRACEHSLPPVLSRRRGCACIGGYQSLFHITRAHNCDRKEVDETPLCRHQLKVVRFQKRNSRWK